MALNQYTTQSAWISSHINEALQVSISTQDTWVSLAPDLTTHTQYNMSEASGRFYQQLKGTYFLDCTFTSEDASNDTLAFRWVNYNSGTLTGSDAILRWDSKGGNRWAVNCNAIIQTWDVVDNDSSSFFGIQIKNIDSTDDIDIESMNVSIIKLY